MNKFIKMKHGLCFLILFASFILPVHAVDSYISDLYRDIDIAFLDKSESELNKILGSNAESLNYYLLENYTMKKIRHLVIAEEYQFALVANLVVIDNDLENTDAVEMYTIISSALEKQKQMREAEEARRKAELAKFEAEKAKKREEAQKNYNSVTTPEGKLVFVQDKHERLTSNYWNLRFGMADFGIINHTFNEGAFKDAYGSKKTNSSTPQEYARYEDFKSEYDSTYTSLKYGVNIDFTYEYAFDKLLLGFDANMEALLISVYRDESRYCDTIINGENLNEEYDPSRCADLSILMNMIVIPKIGITNGRYSIYGRCGFGCLMNFEDDDKVDYDFLSKSFYTPVLGFGVDRIKAGPVTLTANVDYYLGHLFADYGYNFAGGMDLNVSVPLATMERYNVNLNFGIKETMIIKNDGVENRARFTLAIGAENVGKK